MPSRRSFIERSLRQIYNGQPYDDSTITVSLVNSWLIDGTAIAAKKNYTDSYQIEGINYVNNSFYTTFKLLAVTKDENFLYKVVLPEIPIGIGKNEGVATLQFKGTDGQLSYTAVPLSTNQITFQSGMRKIQNKLLYYPEGNALFIYTTIILSQYTATVKMVSAGDSTDLDSNLNVPADYYPVMVEYIKQQLGFEKMQSVDQQNDGVDNSAKK